MQAVEEPTGATGSCGARPRLRFRGNRLVVCRPAAGSLCCRGQARQVTRQIGLPTPIRAILEAVVEIFDELVLESDETLFFAPPFVARVFVGSQSRPAHLSPGPGQSVSSIHFTRRDENTSVGNRLGTTSLYIVPDWKRVCEPASGLEIIERKFFELHKVPDGLIERGGSGRLNNFSASISGASAGVRLPRGAAAS
jgi:hypothetical protein